MKLAFILYHYFPHGGLQRDFLRIAEHCQQKGHEIHVFCTNWTGDLPDWIKLHVIPVTGMSNHKRYANFAQEAVLQTHAQHFDRIIGFNKMPGLDIYYAADGCFATKNSLLNFPLLKFLPRYQTYLQMEQAVFSRHSGCKILSISPKEKLNYQMIYFTADEKFINLPPGISSDRIPPDNVTTIRTQYREQFKISEESFLILSVGSSFDTKGIDRVLHAIAALPDPLKKQCYYLIAGKEKKLKDYIKLAKKLAISSQIEFLGARDDIPALLWTADLLIHAARRENTGTAIVEAIVANLPVIATENCGYAFYVKEAQAGIVLSEPFQQSELNQILVSILNKEQLAKLKQHAQNYALRHDLFSLIDKAVAEILS